MRGIHRSPVNSPHKGQWPGALLLSLICSWINGWVNNREAGDLRRHRAHYDVTVMIYSWFSLTACFSKLIIETRKFPISYFIHGYICLEERKDVFILVARGTCIRYMLQIYIYICIYIWNNKYNSYQTPRDLTCLQVGHGMMTSSNGNIFRAVTDPFEGNSPVTGAIPSQRPVTRSFDVFCDARLSKRLRKQSRSWWFEAPSRSLWRYCIGITTKLISPAQIGLFLSHNLNEYICCWRHKAKHSNF